MNNFTIVSFCSFDYVEVAQNWVSHLSMHNITNYVIITMDDETYDYLNDRNINTKLKPVD